MTAKRFKSLLSASFLTISVLISQLSVAQVGTANLRQKINQELPTNNSKAITAAKLRSVFTASANAIDSIYTTFSLADGIGTFNAATNVGTVKSSGATFTPTTTSSQPNGKYFDVVVAGTVSITGSPVTMQVGGKLISRGTKWDYIPPTDTGYLKSLALEKETAIFENIPLVSLGGTGANGGTISLANNSMSIPNGQVGNSTYLSKALPLSSYPNLAVGDEIIFSAVLSENIAAITAADRPRFQLSVVRSGVTQFNQGENFTMERLTATSVKYTCKYTVQTGDASITPAFQHQLNTVNSSGSTWTWTWQSLFYYARHISASNAVSEKLTSLNADVAASNAKSDIYIPVVPTLFFGEGVNGATLNTTLGKITIPAGQTGQNSYVRGHFPIAQFPNWSDMIGQSCVFRWTFQTSADITDTRTLTATLAVTRNGSSQNNQGTPTLTKLSSTLYEGKVVYTPQAGDSEVRLVVQVTNNVVAAADQFFDLDQFFYTNPVPTGFPSQATYPVSKLIGKITTDIQTNTAGIAAANSKSDTQIPAIPYVYSGQVSNGAVLDVTNAKLTIPVGQTGQGSYVRGQFSTSAFPGWSDMIGVPTTFRYIVYTSADVSDVRTFTVNMSVTRNGSTVSNVAAGTFTKISSGVSVASITYTPLAGDSELRPYVMFANTVTAAAEQWISLGQFSCLYAAPLGYANQVSYSVSKQLDKTNSEINALRSGGNVVRLTVSPDGSKDYLSPKLANDAILDSSPAKWYEIIVYPGTYTEMNWVLKPYTKLIGTNRQTCWLKGENAVNADDNTISLLSTINLQKSSEIHNITITVKNGRYAIHDEEGGANPDAKHKIVNCHIEHYGNQSARDWRTANPGSGLLPGNVWTSEHPYGCGTGSGVEIDLVNTTTIGPNSGFFYHTNKDFSKANINRLTGTNTVKSGAWGNAINLQALGSGQADRFEATDAQILGGYIGLTDSPWITEAASLQVANKAEIDVHIRGGNAVGYLDGTRGRALRITSNNTSGASSVRVTGTAATAIFGNAIERDGAGGLKGYTYGYWDISGILVGMSSNITVNNTLGRRLGNCSGGNSKTLTVVVNGGAPVNVIFNTDLTAATNASIIATINAALGSAATADEFNPAELKYPQMYDRQVFLKNSSATGIPRFSAGCYDGSYQNIRVCTTADNATDFVGIALEDINPGSFGRILKEGVMRYSQVLGIASGSILFNTAISLSGTANGSLAVGSSKQIGKGVTADWMYFKSSN